MQAENTHRKRHNIAIQSLSEWCICILFFFSVYYKNKPSVIVLEIVEMPYLHELKLVCWHFFTTIIFIFFCIVFFFIIFCFFFLLLCSCFCIFIFISIFICFFVIGSFIVFYFSSASSASSSYLFHLLLLLQLLILLHTTNTNSSHFNNNIISYVVLIIMLHFVIIKTNCILFDGSGLFWIWWAFIWYSLKCCVVLYKIHQYLLCRNFALRLPIITLMRQNWCF